MHTTTKLLLVPYRNTASTLPWGTIQAYISSKFPIYMRSFSAISGHATVLFGYKTKNNVIYDSIYY